MTRLESEKDSFAKDIEHYLSLGARGVISKPFDGLGLPDEIRRIVGAR